MALKIMRNAVFMSTGGGVLTALSPEGEVLFDVGIPPGRVAAAPYVDLGDEDTEWKLDRLFVAYPRSGFGRVPYGEGALNSACNVDYRPSRADIEARLLQQRVDQMAELQKTLATEMAELQERRAADVIEVIPTAPEPDVKEVVSESASAV